jgi:hypothetical protein
MKVEQSIESKPSVLRMAAALLICLIVAIYLYAVVSGLIPRDRRLDGIDVTVIGLALLALLLVLQPNILARLRLLEVKGFKVELLEKVRDRQLQQEVELEDIRLVIPLLLPETERNHLRNLASGAVTSYKGNQALRTELRRLRAIGLIRSRNHAVADIKDNIVVALSDYVELTDLGQKWARRLAELEEPKNNNAASTTTA